MRTHHGRATAGLQAATRRDEFVAVLEGLVPHLGDRAEQVGLYVMVSALWGLILYTALTFALP